MSLRSQLRQTAGGEGDRLESVWLPRQLVKRMQGVLRRKRRADAQDSD
jgi:hypothetical protein